MTTVTLTEDTFEDTVTRQGITLVDWWASWCGPCRMFAPVFKAASEKHPDITFGKVDTEDQQGLSAASAVRAPGTRNRPQHRAAAALQRRRPRRRRRDRR
jgi:thioredoxin 1